MKKTYLFDFDGTLVDSMPDWTGKMLNILHHCGMTPPDDLIATITPLGDTGTAAYFKNTLRVPLTEDEMYAMMDNYALPKYRDTILTKEGVKPYLQALKAAGFSLNVLTASPHKMLDPCLKRNGLWELFDHVWTCEDFGLTKSEPTIYLRALEILNTAPSDAVFFDDNIGAVSAAKKAGLYTVGVYDDTATPFLEKMKQTADRYVYSMAELAVGDL